MKIKKRIKKIEKSLYRANMSIIFLSQIMDVFSAAIIKDEYLKNEDIIEKCAKIAEDFFEDDVIAGTQIAKEIRDVMHATPISTKGN